MSSKTLTAALMGLMLCTGSAIAGDFSDFDCDFDSVLEGYGESGVSCDFSNDVDGSFDISCDYDIEDEQSDMSSSGSFDASCDALPNDFYACDSSLSYDYDAPGKSISQDQSCDTYGSGAFLSLDCDSEVKNKTLSKIIESFNIVCGVPQPFESILSTLILSEDHESIKYLAKDLRRDVKSIKGLPMKRKIRRSLKGVFKKTKRGQTDAAAIKLDRAMTLLNEADLSQTQKNQLCATSLFCVFPQ